MITKHCLYVSNGSTFTKKEAINMSPIFVDDLKTKNIRTRKYDLAQIKNIIISGKTINLGLVKNKTLIALDVDNDGVDKYDYETLINKLSNINIYPNLIFNTLNSTENNPRYRVIIALDSPIKNNEQYSIVIKGLVDYLNYYHPNSIDSHVTNVQSIFYPAIQCIYNNYEVLSSTSELLKNVSILYPDKIIQLNLTKFLAPILLNDNLISSKEYDNLCANADTNLNLIITLKKIEGRIPYSLWYRINKKMDDIITKDNIVTDISNLCSYKNNILEVLFMPIVKKNIKIKRHMTNQIKRGVLTKLLNYEEKVFFQDIFSHDSNIKATIMTTDKGEQKYYVYDVSFKKPKLITSYSVIDFLTKLFNFDNYMNLMNFVYKLCNISLDDIPSYSRKKKITDYRNAISSYFDRYKNLKTFLCSQNNSFSKNILDCILEFAYECYEYRDNKIGNSQSTYELQIYCPEKTILEKMTKRNIMIDKSTISKKIVLLAKLGLITYVDSNEYDQHTLALRKKLKNKIKFTKGQPHVFYIPDYNLDLFKKADKIAKNYLDKGFSPFLITHNMDTIKKHEYYVCLSGIIKKHFSEENNKYLVRSDLIKMFQQYYPDKEYRAVACILTKYMPVIILENDLKLYTMKSHNIWHFNLTEETAREKGYVLNKSRVYCKNIMDD